MAMSGISDFVKIVTEIKPINVRGLTLRILNDDDIIEHNDIVRPMSDNVCVRPMDGWDSMSWYYVQQEIPAWIGKTLLDYHAFDNNPDPYVREFEIARIDPESYMYAKLKGQI